MQGSICLWKHKVTPRVFQTKIISLKKRLHAIGFEQTTCSWQDYKSVGTTFYKEKWPYMRLKKKKKNHLFRKYNNLIGRDLAEGILLETD